VICHWSAGLNQLFPPEPPKHKIQYKDARGGNRSLVERIRSSATRRRNKPVTLAKVNLPDVPSD
jgi:hypothetical protein